jgi:predicted Zn-dependent protease
VALRFDPDSGLVAAGYYPSLLLERGQVDSALSYLERIHRRIPDDLERSAVLAAVRGLMTMDQLPLAQDWLERRISEHPGWLYGYELLFHIHEGLGQVNQAAAVVERWRSVHGEDDPGLRFLLQRLREDAQNQELERMDQLLRERGDQPEER